MDVLITSFHSPFSFFCILEKDVNANLPFESLKLPLDTGTNDFSKLSHGQYVSVLWKKKWVRGKVNMEDKVLIWLVDYGFHLRVDEKTVWKELTPDLKKITTRVFEASVHGVLPVDKEVNEDCQIVDMTSTVWTKGAITQAKTAISTAQGLVLQPVARLATDHNDIVLVDLYLDIPRKGVVNLLDELEGWPKFMERKPEAYIENLSKCYKERRRHPVKPAFPDLPTVSPGTSLDEYSDIYENTPQLLPKSTPRYHTDCSTVVGPGNVQKYTLTPEEIEEYSNMYIEIGGREYNLLNVLVNKIRDLTMCEMYQNHDLKGMGRGVYFKRY